MGSIFKKARKVAKGAGVGAALGHDTQQRALDVIAPSAPSVNTSAINTANQEKDAANAVLTADAEGRRARAAKRQGSVLGNYNAGQQVSKATLQPARSRRSVLG